MELDDLKGVWAVQGAALERSVAINERLLREVLLGKARAALAPYVLWRAGEVVIGIAVFTAVMSVLIARAADPLHVIVAGALSALTGWITVLCAYLLVSSLTLDYGNPAIELQRDLERLKVVEFRAFSWALLGGVAAWLPLGLVLVEALSGVDALARVDRAWLIGNIVVGLVTLGGGRTLVRRYVERPDADPRGGRIVDALSGRALRRATAHLAELARFEHEDC